MSSTYFSLKQADSRSDKQNVQPALGLEEVVLYRLGVVLLPEAVQRGLFCSLTAFLKNISGWPFLRRSNLSREQLMRLAVASRNLRS